MRPWHYVAIIGIVIAVGVGFGSYALYPGDEVCKPQETTQNPLHEEERASYTVSFLKYLEAHIIGESTKTVEDKRSDQGDYYACRLSNYTRQLSVFTAALVIVTAFLFAIGVYQGIQLSRHAGHMESSAAEASRAAAAMEQVASGIAESVENTRQVLATQRDFAQRQMRAYLSIIDPGYVLQDRTAPYFLEFQLNMINTGHTPAHRIRFAARLRALPVPLPDTFDFSIPANEFIVSGHLNPGQKQFFRRNLGRLMEDDELNAVMGGPTPIRAYIYGTILFDDVFGIERHTNFCQFGLWDKAMRFSTMNTSRHNDAT
jgi:hypothetical protein